MSKALITESILTNIADAIRAKTGETATMKPTEMAEKISGISGGGSDATARAIVNRTITEYADEELETVGKNAFYYCTNLTSVNIPACTSLDQSAFSSCSKLTSVDLPACTSLGSSAFFYCTSLTSVDLPVCTSLGNSAFSSCTSLTSVDLPACTSLGSSAFSSCTSLTSVDLPACTSLGSSAFSYCTSLTSVDLPACTSLDGNDFSNCTALTTLELPSLNSLSSAYNSFYSTSIQNLLLGVTKFNSTIQNIFGYSGTSKLTKLSLPNCTGFSSATALSVSYAKALTEIHFAAANQEAIEADANYGTKWGATNATIYFDL